MLAGRRYLNIATISVLVLLVLVVPMFVLFRTIFSLIPGIPPSSIRALLFVALRMLFLLPGLVC